MVLGDAPSLYWRLGESSRVTVADASGNGRTGWYRNNLTYGVTGALAGSSDTAVACPGTSGLAYSTDSVSGPTTYSLELFFQSTSNRGGKLIGLEDVQTGWGDTYDRHVYLTNAGHLAYGIRSGGAQHVIETSAGYNDGAWHHVVATQDVDGMTLYVDGVAVASNPTTTPDAATGYWRVGGGNLTGWPNRPASSAVAGAIDEVVVYARALSTAEVAEHTAAAAP
jgi:hypothetical protein